MDDLSRIKEVKTVCSEDEVNKLLNQDNWYLLDLYTYCLDPVNAPKNLSVKYVVGKYVSIIDEVTQSLKGEKNKSKFGL